MASFGRWAVAIWILAAMATGILARASAADAARSDLTRENVAGFFDAAFSVQVQSRELVGVVVSVVKDGEVLFKQGYGWADLENRVPADPDRSLFRIASISKPFVWTSIMQLVEQGRLELDDDVNDHLHRFQVPATFSEPIRIRHLLSHTPGLEDRAIGMGAPSLEERLALPVYLETRMPERVRPPGVQASYSNWGTALAGLILENVTGSSWEDYVEAHILEPLEMRSTNTRSVLTDDFAARMATSYAWSAGRFVAKPYTYMNDAPAGVMSTTADDMTRFMIAHLNLGNWKDRRILREDTARQMQSPLFAPHPGISPMLHGFNRADRNGQVIFGHGGDANQFHSVMSLFPDHRLGVFISFNSDPAAAARGDLIRAFTDRFFPEPYLRDAPTAEDVALSDYTGEYVPLRSNVSNIERLGILVMGIAVTEADGELVLNGASRWVPTGDDRFTGRYANRTMVFERQNGAVSHLLVDSPLSTFRKVTGLDAPGNLRNLMGAMVIVALVTVLGYGYRAVRRAPPADRLPRWNIAAAWVHALGIVAFYGFLAYLLSGDVEAFVYGLPTNMQVLLIVMCANALLGVAVAAAAVRLWLTSAGRPLARVRYSVVGVAALINLWVTWYFNILTYPFAG